MSATAHKKLFRDYLHVWQTGDLDGLDTVVHPDYVGHPPQGDRDAAGLRQRILAFHQDYSTIAFKIEDQLVEGDKIATRLTAAATRAADGEKLKLYGHNICRIADGRVIEEWLAWEVQPAR